MSQRSLQVTIVFLMTIVCLMIGTVPADSAEGRIPITTSSEKAREFFIQGRELVEKFHNQEARELFEKAIEEDPNFAMAHLYLSYTRTTTTAFFESMYKAMSLLGRVSEGEQLWILGAEADFSGEPMRQRLLYKQLVTAYPDDERAHSQLAAHFFGQQQYALAVEKYKASVEIAPEFSAPYNMLGYSYRSLEDYESAEKAFKKYIELIPNESNPYDSYAELLLKTGKYDASIETYRKALSLDPNFAPSHIGIATNLNYQGKHSAARMQLREMYENARDDLHRRRALFATAVSYVDEGAIDKALEQLDKQLALSAKADDRVGMAENLRITALVLFEADRYDEALEKDSEATRLILESDLAESIKEQTRVRVFYVEARYALATGDIETARTKSRKYGKLVLNTDRTFQVMAAHELAGLIALEEEDFNRAIDELEQSNSQNTRHLYELAQAYDHSGDSSKAREVYRRIVDYNALNSLEYSFVRHKAQEALALI